MDVNSPGAWLVVLLIGLSVLFGGLAWRGAATHAETVPEPNRPRCTINHARLPLCHMPSSELHGARNTSVRAGQQENVSGTVAQMVSGMPGLQAPLCNR
jgi:hypothetical protein